VFPDEAFMQGTIRTYNDKTLDVVKAKIRLLAENTAIAMGCVA
jgi:metal-dependent amidase/aminoacylase/carboxypeptidase family protein